MNRIIKTITVSVLSLVLMTQIVYAKGVQYENVICNPSLSEITVEGKAGKNENVTVQILFDGKSLFDIASGSNENVIAFNGEYVTGENGEFEFTAELSESGKYDIYIADSETGAIKVFENVKFVSFEDFNAAVEALMGAEDMDADEEGFPYVFSLTRDTLGFDAVEGADEEKVVALLFNETREGKTPLGSSDAKGCVDLYKICVAIDLLNNENIDNAGDYLDIAAQKDEELYVYYKKHIKSEDAEEFLTEKMEGKNFDSIDAFEDALVEGIILTAVKYPDGYKNIQKIFEKYNDVLGIRNVSDEKAVYTALAGKSYDDIPKLKAAYDKAVKDAKEESSGGGGMGGTTASGTTGTPVTTGGISGDILVTPTVNENKKITMQFVDLNSVPWAYEAISRLYDKEIVNGVNETEFHPEHTVTREEFIKMIVSAMNLPVDDSLTTDFLDVERGAWYEKYVAAAYNRGITKGVGDSMFGTGRSITREDMAVMIYNVMVMKGYKDSGMGAAFIDGSELSSYAVKAVNELYAMGIITGDENNRFNPKGEATRAQAAVILDRALKYLQ